MVSVLFAPWASRLIQSANIQPNDRVLDVGCGTGIVARLIVSYTNFQGTVSGLDLSPPHVICRSCDVTINRSRIKPDEVHCPTVDIMFDRQSETEHNLIRNP
jgi:cyclopropane fatty-acyl-phospholipid synthase-like methyltransferase